MKGKTHRGTSNTNARGSAKQRRVRKQWLLDTFGDGVKALCSFGCGAVLTLETITVDRFPVLGADGGTYRRGNIRPACGHCNSVDGGKVSARRRLARKEQAA